MEEKDSHTCNSPLIIVTRVGTAEEWEDWGFESEKVFAYIEVDKFEVSAFKQFDLDLFLDKMDEDTLFVFNGDEFVSLIKNEICNVDWKEKEQILRIHHENFYEGHIEKLLSGEKQKNAKNFLDDYVPYTLDGDDLSDCDFPVARVGRAVKNRDHDALRTSVRGLRGAKEWVKDGGQSERDGDARDRTHDLVSQFSMLKHKLSHLFIPLSIDLQGWKESGFSSDYAQEIAEDYKGKTDKIEDESKEILRDIKEVVGAIDQAKTKKIERILYKFKQKESEPNYTLNRIHKIDHKKHRLEIENNVKGNDNFKEWLSSLETKMNKLRESIQ